MQSRAVCAMKTRRVFVAKAAWSKSLFDPSGIAITPIVFSGMAASRCHAVSNVGFGIVELTMRPYAQSPRKSRVAQSLDTRSRGESACPRIFNLARSETSRKATARACFPDLVHHHPPRLQDRIRDQTDDRGRGDQERIAHLPAEQHGERDDADQRRQPVADRDLSKQDAGAQDRANRR